MKIMKAVVSTALCAAIILPTAGNALSACAE